MLSRTTKAGLSVLKVTTFQVVRADSTVLLDDVFPLHTAEQMDILEIITYTDSIFFLILMVICTLHVFTHINMYNTNLAEDSSDMN